MSILSENFQIYNTVNICFINCIDVNSNFMLIGDLNARTAKICDFIIGNRTVTEYEAVVDTLYDSHLNMRRSHDTSVNSFCLTLLEYYKANVIRIVNG